MKISQLRMLSSRIFTDLELGSGTVAIVGNGVVEEDSTPIILGSKVVVRFNDYNRRRTYRSESTKRCDVLCTHYDAHPFAGENGFDIPKSVVIIIPAPFKTDRISEYSDRWYADQDLYMVNPYLNRMLCVELGLNSDGCRHPLPTAGMTALYHLSNLGGKFYIAGFDWHVDFDNETIDRRPIELEKRQHNWNHFYASEARWVHKNLFGRDNIYFSERSRRAMEIVGRHVDDSP